VRLRGGDEGREWRGLDSLREPSDISPSTLFDTLPTSVNDLEVKQKKYDSKRERKEEEDIRADGRGDRVFLYFSLLDLQVIHRSG
jgi:hypothetical protein